ncbi:GNAT superfamily N-acetyltransferase [Bradyrhizobium sp. AZCC 2262]|uniref:GNAT family N-acetyltransferase n=1 Tax=Bradyrhizobium sp. AZCC 2262 TaxID=3117022 RepID=UPI002FEEDE41
MFDLDPRRLGASHANGSLTDELRPVLAGRDAHSGARKNIRVFDGAPLRANDGSVALLRFADPRDREKLQAYFRSLSPQSRHNRFLVGLSELPPAELDRFVRNDDESRFTVLVTTIGDGFESIVGEARFAHDKECASVEFGLSIADSLQHIGFGRALVKTIEAHVSRLGAARIFGDALYSNNSIIRLAKSMGFAVARNPGDPKLIRFEKALAGPRDTVLSI